MQQPSYTSPEELDHQATCFCNICQRRTPSIVKIASSDIGTPNCMNQFIKSLPLGFPIWLQQTIVLNRREDGNLQYHSYQNPTKDESTISRSVQKCSIVHQQLRGLSTLPCQNVIIYLSNRQRILPRFQLISMLAQSKQQKMTSEGDILYIQAYQPQPIIRTEYINQQMSKLDNILLQYIQKQQKQFHPDKIKMNEEILDWVFRQYGEQTLFDLLTILYIKFYKLMTGNQITRAVFLWSRQPLNKQLTSFQTRGSAGQEYNKMMQIGRPKKLTFKPKLINVRELSIKKYEKLFSFQQEYQDLIRNRIQSTSKKTISAIKNKVYRSRLENFRNKIHRIYDDEQKSIMDQIHQEKQFEYQHDTDQMARMLIPNMGPYKNLREILSNQKAFGEVFLNQITKNQKSKRNALPRVQRSNAHKKVSSVTSFEGKIASLATPNRHKRYLKLMTTPSTLQ